MSEWTEVTLGSLVDVMVDNRGKTPPTCEFGYELLEVNAILQDRRTPDYSKVRKFISEETYKNWFRKGHPQSGDIIVPTVGTIGNVALVQEARGAIAQNLIALRLKNGIDSRFVYYFLSSPHGRELMLNLDIGGVQPSIKVPHLLDMMVPLVSYNEQKAIAAVLSSFDDKIGLLHRQNKTLEAMAEALFRQWFIEEAQADWEEKKLGELFTITSSKRIFYSEYVETGIPFYRSKEIIELHNSGATKSELCISQERYDDIKKNFGVPLEGDILLTSVGTLGIPYRVKKNDTFYFKDGNLTWFKDFASIPSIVVYCWLKSSIGKEQLDSITIGSTQSALTISGLREIKLLIPPKEKMKAIEENFMFIYNKIGANQSQIRTLEKIRDTLLPKLMSGEVMVHRDE